MRNLKIISLTILLLFTSVCYAQDEQPQDKVIAIFPLKNLYGDPKYDDLIWSYADSLFSALKEDAGTGITMLTMDDVRDHMLALNIDPYSPTYETDIMKSAKVLGTQKFLYGTFKVKYEKVTIEIKICDSETFICDLTNIAEVKAPYNEAMSTVKEAAAMLLSGF